MQPTSASSSSSSSWSRKRRRNHVFRNGDRVEVRRNNDPSRWFKAVIVGSSRDMGEKNILVEYLNSSTSGGFRFPGGKRQEYVPAGNVRPVPPQQLQRPCFKAGDPVDVLDANAWMQGEIVNVLDKNNSATTGTTYLVSFRNLINGNAPQQDDQEEELEVVYPFHERFLRPHRQWLDGSWQQQLIPSSASTSQQPLQILSRPEEPKFRKGTKVEVKSIEKGYLGAWYAAVVIGPVGEDDMTYLVEYQTLTTDDESQLLREKADVFSIRPYPPPEITSRRHFRLFDKVDTWYNDGWWVGVVSRVLVEGSKYMIYFWTTNEELEFRHEDLRSHQEFIGGTWVVAAADFLGAGPSGLPLKPRPGNVERQNGKPKAAEEEYYFPKVTEVEVTNDDDGEGYPHFWYPAIVISPKDDGKFLLEFMTLESDNEMGGLLREEVDFRCMRPSPPEIHRTEPFELSQLVDAWHNNLWWVGSICQVFPGANYDVRIRGTGQVVRFQHCELRTHQDWIDGKWLVPSMALKMSDLASS